jgi:hypothetical protein
MKLINEYKLPFQYLLKNEQTTSYTQLLELGIDLQPTSLVQAHHGTQAPILSLVVGHQDFLSLII